MKDSILFWNAVALEANRVSHSDPDKREQNGPTLSSRAIAIVHLAMYDAYAAIIGGANFPRYLKSPPLPAPPPTPPAAMPTSSVADAVAGAAHRTLSMLYKSQKDYFDAQLSCFDQTDPYFAFGEAVGQTLLEFRANDPDARDCGYMTSPARGRHRRDPGNPGQGFHGPFYGAQSKGFAISVRHALDAPPFANGDDDIYEAALREVRAKGIMPELMGTLPDNMSDDKRTPEESLIGIYWAYDGANRLGTPPRLYNQIIREVAEKKSNDEGTNARLFAFVNAAMGDAGILAWEQKFCHDFWRPVVGIREHDKSFGPAATDQNATNKISQDADPFWLPLGSPSTNTSMKNFTPDFPAYPSGHATFGAAVFHITRLFYGAKKGDRKPDDLFKDCAFVSDELNGGNRDNRGTVRPRHVRDFNDGLWQMIIENGESRIYLGVHWFFDAFARRGNKPDLSKRVGGVRLGLDIAEDIYFKSDGTPRKAPMMTPKDKAEPPITTPKPNSPMPTTPQQPASVGKCADEPEKVRAEKPEGLKPEMVKEPWPSGRSER